MSNASSICIPQEHVAMQVVRPRTDGRTNEEGLSPTRDLSSSVTRTRTYGDIPVQPITPAMWRRMPWHPQARVTARLVAEATQAERRLEQLRQAVTEERLRLDRVVACTVAIAALNEDVGNSRMLAEEHYRSRGGPDPEGPARLAVALAEVDEVRPAGRKTRRFEVAS